MAARHRRPLPQPSRIPRSQIRLLPGHEPTEEQVARVVAELQGIVRDTMERGIIRLGDYLLDTFYGGDVETYRSTNPHKHSSLRWVLERCEQLDVPLSRTGLSNALRVAAFSRSLPKGATFTQLPPSHQVEMVRVADPVKVERLAMQVVETGMTVRDLRAVVRKDQEGKPRTGRPAQPEVLKALRACERQLTDQRTGRARFLKADMESLDEEERDEVNAILAAVGRRLNTIQRLMG